MTWHNLKDRASTNLASAYTQGSGTLEVVDANLLPSVPFYLSAYDSTSGYHYCEWEVTAATGNTLTVVALSGDQDLAIGISVGILTTSKNLVEVRDAVDDLTTTVTTQDSTISTLESTVAGYSSAISTMESTVSTLNTTVSGHTTSIGSLNTTVSGHTTSINTVTSDLGTLSSTVAGHTTSIGTLNTTVSGHTTTLGTVTSDVSALSTTVSGHTGDISSLQSAVSLQGSDIDTINLALAGKANTSHTHAASAITSGTVDTARLGSGTANSTTYLRGDQTWATVSGGGGMAIGGSVSGSTANRMLYTDSNGNLTNTTGTYVYPSQIDMHPDRLTTPLKFFAAENQDANLLSCYNYQGWPLFWIDRDGGLAVQTLQFGGRLITSTYSVTSTFCNANSRYNFINPNGGEGTALLPPSVVGTVITVKNVGGSGTVQCYDNTTWDAVGTALTSGNSVTAVYDGGTWQVIK